MMDTPHSAFMSKSKSKSNTTTVIGANARVVRWDDAEIKANQEKMRAAFRRLHERANQIEIVDEQVQQASHSFPRTNHQPTQQTSPRTPRLRTTNTKQPEPSRNLEFRV
jgi:hypothetical protein